MRKITFFRNLIVLVALLIGSGSVTGQTEQVIYSTGFEAAESFTAGTVYNNTTVKMDGPAGQQWGTYYGTASTTGPIAGSMSMQMRYYTANPDRHGYTYTDFDLSNVTKVVFKALNTSGNNVSVSYSTDGGSTYTGAQTFILGTSASTFTYNISATGEYASVRIRFQLVPGTTNSTRVTLDDVQVYGMVSATPTVVTPTIEVSAGVAKSTNTYFNTAEVTLNTATEGASIYYTVNGDAPTTSSTLYATPFSVTTTTTIKALAVKAEMDDSNVTEKTITIVAPATATIPYTEAFNNTLSDWYTYEVAGAKPWLASVDGALGNGFAGGDVESWLISPKFTATEDGLALSFNYASRFVGNPILVKVSTDYIGYGTPTAATWTTASSISAPEVQDNDYTVKASGNIITLNEGTVYFALVYDNDAAPYSDWRITNANVVLPPSSPTITVTQGSVPAMSAEVGSTDAEIITVNGLNLTGNIALAVTGTDASLFTLSTYSIAPTEGNVTDQSVTITYTPTAAGSHTATLTLSSTGAEDVVRSLSASSIWPPLSAPVATDATAISQTGFQANWNTVNGATAYDLSVYTKEVGTSANLVVNPGFESGEATPWVFESAMNQEVVTTVVKSGTYVLKTAVIATKNLNQTITVVNGKEYKLSFWYYIDGASTGNGFRVWTTSGATINLPSSTTYFNTKASWQYVETTFTASANVLVLNLRTYNGCTLYLDDFELTTDETTITPISGSPFTVIGETSKAITGLTASTTYYYNVKAENVNVESAVSNEISVITSFGTANQNPSITQIFAHNSQIRFSATAGEQVEVYNAVGQKVISTLATDGQNVLNVREKGVMIVKVGDRMAKVIL